MNNKFTEEELTVLQFILLDELCSLFNSADSNYRSKRKDVSCYLIRLYKKISSMKEEKRNG